MNSRYRDIERELKDARYSAFTRYAPSFALAPDSDSVRIAVLRSYTAEPREPVLRVLLGLKGIATTILFGGYNQYSQEVLDPTSEIRKFEPNISLFMVRLEEMLPEFFTSFGQHSSSYWFERIDSIAVELVGLVQSLVSDTGSQALPRTTSTPQPCPRCTDSPPARRSRS